MTSSRVEEQRTEKSVYDFTMPSITGEEIELSRYKGKKMLIVNTASKCGYTPQYADLEKLYKQYGDKVTVLGFPANNFLYQEPGSNETIALFCKNKYDVTFPMFSKISVKGKTQHPLYQWLQEQSGSSPSWNFCKYLIDERGNMVQFYPAKVNPLDSAIVNAVVQ